MEWCVKKKVKKSLKKKTVVVSSSGFCFVLEKTKELKLEWCINHVVSVFWAEGKQGPSSSLS